MKLKLIFLFLLLYSFALSAQDMKGIWRGYFYSGYGYFREQYKYEVQLNQLANNSLEGVTYSYKTTVFYGKATLSGIYFSKSNTVQFKETKLVELKIAGQSVACLMECTLDYSKEGNTEYLKGTFTSIVADTKSDCGSGTVFLERVAESDFEKEDFLISRKPDPKYRIPDVNKTSKPFAPTTNNATANTKSKENIKRLQTALGVTPDGIAGPKTLATLRTKVPGFTGSLPASDPAQIEKLITQIKQHNSFTSIKKPTLPIVKDQLPPPIVKKPPVTNTNDSIAKSNPLKPPVADTAQKIITQKKLLVPEAIKNRENSLVKTITTNSPDIKIQLYDNGEVDGDVITVYHNNEVIAFKRGLSRNPITINIKSDEVNTHHEFVMVADNLGSIPPNTALMVIYAGGKRYELFISSDKEKNAKVIINYEPK